MEHLLEEQLHWSQIFWRKTEILALIEIPIAMKNKDVVRHINRVVGLWFHGKVNVWALCSLNSNSASVSVSSNTAVSEPLATNNGSVSSDSEADGIRSWFGCSNTWKGEASWIVSCSSRRRTLSCVRSELGAVIGFVINSKLANV
ncbi:hypothetical protein WICPIJ_004143 [Wickerhamomyces pijperi]|uniref:Uncharacterized protein n=1 Tax=Wickerhamomyces pijperi TaxID=599730 RepID=A0A9P8Q6F3_WICPI|nr:hypothetical protein WICPIJ_004143 [Wickerhamomyces pijperi]